MTMFSLIHPLPPVAGLKHLVEDERYQEDLKREERDIAERMDPDVVDVTEYQEVQGHRARPRG